jgi:hypothetical protein
VPQGLRHNWSMATRVKKMIPEFGQIWQPVNPSLSHQRFGNLWLSWMFWMFALDNAQTCLGARATHVKRKGEVVMPAILAVRAMLLGYAVECGLKALWLRKGNQLIAGGKYQGVKGAQDHNLVQLCKVVGFSVTPKEEAVLKRLTKFARFAGRYPVSKTADEMEPDKLTQADAGFFSKQDFRTSESLLNKLRAATSGKKRNSIPRRPRKPAFFRA